MNVTGLPELKQWLAEQVNLDRFVGIPEAAHRLGVHAETAREWVRAGTFPVPVRMVGSKQVVSLRRLAEYINAATDDDLSAAS